MDPLKTAIVSLSILSLGLSSIHAAEKLRWFEPRRGLWKIAAAAVSIFAVACALLMLHRGIPFGPAAYFQTLLRMLFLTYFLVALTYLLHCMEWVITRLGMRVHLDELFSRLLTLAVFTAFALTACLALLIFFDGI
jgi:hypothetical protein